MAVYTELSNDFIRYMLAIYADAGQLQAAHGISAGSTNTSYRLETSTGEFFLRVNENKRFSELVYEKNLLLYLEGKGARVTDVHFPEMLKNAAGGYFFPIESAQAGKNRKYACIFRGLRGRELAPFEVTEEQVHELGRVLARLHLALRTFRGGRSNPYGAGRMQAWLRDLARTRNATVVGQLQDAFQRALRERRALPRGVIHGDLFANNTKWHRGRLHAVFDWEMAGRDHLLLDLAIVLNAWCWQRESGAEGFFDRSRLRALMRGYQSVRPLTDTERRGLHVECRLAALRFAISRYRDFGEPPDSMANVVQLPATQSDDATRTPAEHGGPHRDFLNYQEYWARHEMWSRLGRKGTAAWLGVEAPFSPGAVSASLGVPPPQRATERAG